jgi:hypothetical protein
MAGGMVLTHPIPVKTATMPALTLYARKEPTTDDLPQRVKLSDRAAKAIAQKRDVVYYRDAAATHVYARSPWYQKPQDKRHRWLQGCDVRWRIVWLPDLAPEGASR